MLASGVLRIFLLLLALGALFPATYSQISAAQHPLAGFTRKEYKAGAQNWAITQDALGRMYIANNEGLLVYDGTNWQLFPVPNQTILRSLSFGPRGRLYAGAQDEMGYFEPNASGSLQFTSLKPLLAEGQRRFTDVWQIVVLDSFVYFRTEGRLFQYTGNKMVVHEGPWLSIHTHLGKLMAHHKTQGLLLLNNNQWQQLMAAQVLPPGFNINSSVPYNQNSSLLATTLQGLQLLGQNQLTAFAIKGSALTQNQHFTALQVLPDSSLMVGSYSNGTYHLDKNGVLIANISTQNGLPNNTVRCLYADSSLCLWMGLDNGLAFYEYASPIQHINPVSFNKGVGYSTQAMGDHLYYSLSTGIFSQPLANIFKIGSLPNMPQPLMDGLSWNLQALNNHLLAGRDDGFWQLKPQNNLVNDASGYWTFKHLNHGDTPLLVAGHYTGLQLYSREANRYQLLRSIKGFTESSRFVETDGPFIWISHPYRGIYRVDSRTDSVMLFTQQDGLPSDLDNHVFKVKNQIVFATTAGIYEYDPARRGMVASPAYLNLFGKLPIRYLKEDGYGNLWFVQDKMVGVADFSTETPKLHYIPELNGKMVSGFEHIYPLSLQQVIMGSETGYYLINYLAYKQQLKPLQPYLTQAKAFGAFDSLLYGGYQFSTGSALPTHALPYVINAIHFAFAASTYAQSNSLEFSYFLEGFDKGWSAWSAKAEKDYTNLPAGKYKFHIKARTSPSHNSEVYSYTFSVQPPWYKSWWAYLLYTLLIGAALYGLLKLQARRYKKRQEKRRLADQLKFEEEQRRLAYQHQLEIEQSEKALIQLQNEKLEAEISHKNAELASATMNLVHKKEFIQKLKADVQQLQKTARVGDDNQELKKLLKVLNEEEKLDNEWEHFSQHFNSVHGDFLTKLKNKFPALKPHELQLCAYLRMNLTSKEIAPLMSISIRGVEISRYRLRKKLQLSTEENLAEFLSKV